ncbi:NO-inducible flavohemoprotein [Paenibacillus macquariensis]|uniref:Flavohemoprotein n=1 Tax=Paenibacillus macquariensis TaxID=948756 RepID=A0ABY1JKS4_9BACL|nr:NO-inducible flavohemoprotein [Paenibacillus macquariensis]MEC0090001.1 NO-inducible flavohemoprotein [Paenibacillus macquariensis]OAB31114.1 nitric oxide dioxygenase [Paenibacillus macquariensis subsp. macquariensis]SIQ35868.1 nitric oxide dioxygenase [Paenibacillus macquariensis]
MLNQHTIEIIKSTVPVLQVYGKTITTAFYGMLFENHPELLNIFNHANQRQGKQQTALANAVLAAAVNIDKLENILPVVKQISEKHRALGVLPEHYPIVGETLLAAISQVLGDAATPEIIDAWAQAYGVIADAFIGVEADMYHKVADAPGGWSGFRNFIVSKKIKESELITSFYLSPQDGGAISAYLPGQYITLRVQPDGEEYTHIRHYSLSAAPGQPYYRITVKREDGAANKPAGIVSTYLHEAVDVGTVVEVSAPAGDFTLDQSIDIPVVLIGGGVGLTPMVSMLETLANEQPGRKVTYIHAAINGRLHAMKGLIDELNQSHPLLSSYVCYESPTEGDTFDKSGYIDLPWLQKVVDSNSDFYFCGPTPFMSTIFKALQAWSIPQDRIHFEFFGPAGSLEE